MILSREGTVEPNLEWKDAEQVRTGETLDKQHDVTNLGRTPELLNHAAYGPVVHAALREGGQICAEVVGRTVDLVARVRDGRETTSLAGFAEDIALIVAVEVAPTITHTIGGLAVDGGCRVLLRADGPLPGLYAAGVEVGGVSVGGYTSGLASALVFGRVAAESALGD